MNIEVLTIFPDMFDSFLAYGIVSRAIKSGRIRVSPVNIRDYAAGKHRQTDDRPYGGGAGMVMMPEPLAGSINAARKKDGRAKVILLTPQGRPFDQDTAGKLAKESGLVFVCGRYEGVDERIRSDYIDDEISIGDYVLTGGEIAAMVVIDAVIRLIPGVLGSDESATADSFSNGLLEHAHYTRPQIFRAGAVPDVLLSGNHAKIDEWRLESALVRTFLKRPDLLEKKALSSREKAILKKWCDNIERLVSGQDSGHQGGDALSRADTLSGEEP
ncbi:MAG: tRNA (guanosine(37)-N1)-methyltransferase TrmD [Deltaproteobacteria bacterium]|nr:tRNA (guanosine(37)-N1)-methyltransferase TrmD [Deltaproteobacteria bacterium]